MYDEGSTERYCLEQFRRAIVERDEAAWCAIYCRYSGMVRRWLGGRMDPEEGVAVTFERFWRAIDAAKLDHFSTLASVLAYLRMCARSAALDAARAQRSVMITQDLETAGDLRSDEDLEAAAVERDEAAVLWQRVQESLTDERERLVVYLSYVIGFSPRQILARHPALFGDISVVYRLKRNALEKLRRLPAIQAPCPAPQPISSEEPR